MIVNVRFSSETSVKEIWYAPGNLGIESERDSRELKEPPEIAFRKKLGFIVPIRIWLADERYNSDVRRLLSGDICAEFFKPEEIKAIYDEYIGGNSDLWRKIWTIYTFLVWYEDYFIKR